MGYTLHRICPNGIIYPRVAQEEPANSETRSSHPLEANHARSRTRYRVDGVYRIIINSRVVGESGPSRSKAFGGFFDGKENGGREASGESLDCRQGYSPEPAHEVPNDRDGGSLQETGSLESE